MEQKKLSHRFEEEFKKLTSLKVFWICLAVMVAGFLALCATVFYLDNGSAAKVLSGKEQLMANVWGRVFAAIAVMPVVIILLMFGFAALMGGLSVIAEQKKRKQAAILGAPQIQKQSKDSEFAAQEQQALIEPEESKAAEQEQMVPVAQAEVPQVQPEPIVQESVVEQAETVESEETQKEETLIAQAEESPAQPEPIAQEPTAEQTEVAEHVDSAEVKEVEEEVQTKNEEPMESKTDTEVEDRSEKKRCVRGEDHGKASKVTIDHDRFRSVFKLIFMKRNADTDSCSYDTLVKTLENNTWTKYDLARVALLIHESDVLTGNNPTDNSQADTRKVRDRKKFNKWLVEFFEIMGRDDIPQTKTATEFNDFSKSSINFRQVFNDLVYTYYAKTEKSTLKFDIPISK